MRHAQFMLLPDECNEHQVVLADVGPHTLFPTVTNDVEHVVAQLLQAGRLHVGQRLFYYDTDGERDEIVFDAEGFVAFAPGQSQFKDEGRVP